MSLLAAKRSLLQAELNPGTLTVTSLTSPSSEPTSGPTSEPDGFGTQTLDLSLRLGDVSLSLDELASLRVGSTIATAIELHQPRVDIFHDGQRLGRGVLVALDCVLGVEIREWIASDD